MASTSTTTTSTCIDAASTYLTHSAKVQAKVFDKLLAYVEIQQGWKVLDIGCGTGNSTVKMCNMVGPQGKVIGIDPIKERIDVARLNCKSKNIDYHVALGEDVDKFGDGEFDLVAAGTVIHWIRKEGKQKLFQSVFKCLKPGGMFIFNSMYNMSVNWLKLLPYLSDKSIGSNTYSSIFCETTEEYQGLASQSGFTLVSIELKESVLPFDSLKTGIESMAASLHCIEYDTLIEELTRVFNDKELDVSFMYDENGHAAYKNVHQYVVCQKPL